MQYSITPYKFLVLVILLTKFQYSLLAQLTIPPNILIIMADDLGFSDIGCYGGEIPTPNLDQLAQRGVKFTQFYNAARCCPSRASLLSGVYPHQAGMGGMVVSEVKNREPETPYQGWLSRRTMTIAEALKTKGYTTYLAGKWHVGEAPEDWPLQRGFDYFFGLIGGANSYYELLPNRLMLEGNAVFTPPANFYMTEATTNKALEYLVHSQSQTKPFFMYLAYTAPHWPLHAPESAIQEHLKTYQKGWDELRQQRFIKQQKLGLWREPLVASDPSTEVQPWAQVTDKEAWVRKMATYAAMVNLMDQGIGKIVAQLKKTGQLDNTLIVFLSDNGACAEVIDRRAKKDIGEERYRASLASTIGSAGSYVAYGKPWATLGSTPFKLYKQYTHEGGIATPMIVHYPNLIKKSFQTEQVGHIMDIMPTCLELAGVAYPYIYKGQVLQALEGKSIVPILQGKKRKAHTLLGWEHFDSRALRRGNWKLVWSKNIKKWELYHISKDRTEREDLAQRHPRRLNAMIEHYARWAKKVGVREQTPSETPE